MVGGLHHLGVFGELSFFYLAERTAELFGNLPNSPRMGTATRAVPPRLLMGYLQQQEPAELGGQVPLLNKIGLLSVHRLSSIHRQESQEKLL
jgi:hypothetical protein